MHILNALIWLSCLHLYGLKYKLFTGFCACKGNSIFWKGKSARHIPRILLLLGRFVNEKSTKFNKNSWHFLKNFMSTLKSSFNTFGNFSENITHWKNFQILIYKTLKIGKSTVLINFSRSSILFASKLTGVDQVLTKTFQIDPKLTFNIFHILNHGSISKIERNIWW